VRPEDHLHRSLAPRERTALAFEIAALYARARYLLRRRPLPVVLADLRGCESGPSPAHPAAPFRLAWAVERVLGRLPGDTRCLARSVVLVGLLARRSTPTTLVIGVQPRDGFKAHGWVELEGRALLPDGGAEYERLTEL